MIPPIANTDRLPRGDSSLARAPTPARAARYDTCVCPDWLVLGGTSVAAPFVAAIYALAGNTSTFTTSTTGSTAGQGLYGAALNPVTSGGDSQGCASYLCNAADSLASGCNAPTGNGTPNGTAGF